MKRLISTAFLVSLLGLAVLVPAASAELSFCPDGSAAKQCNNPQGIAVDNETGRIYVADSGNHRINVFQLSPAGDKVDFIAAFGWGVVNADEQFQVCTTSCLAGREGSGLGQFSKPTAIAVDNVVGSPNRHSVYVMDANRRLQKFDPEPLAPELAFPVSPGDGECEFSRGGNPVAVGPGGTVYVADRAAKGVDDFIARVQKFNPETGACAGEVALGEGNLNSKSLEKLAVDAGGNSYVTLEEAPVFFAALRKYGPSGEFLQELDEAISTDIETKALAIGPSGDLFAAQRDGGAPFFSGGVITQYDTDGSPLVRFGYGVVPLNALALAIHHSAGGDVFLNTGDAGVRYLKLPSDNRPIVPLPCEANPLGNTKATLNSFVNPEGKATAVSFEYISDAQFQQNLIESLDGFAGATSSPESESIGSDFKAHKASASISGLKPETKYHCRLVATNADGSATGVEGAFITLEPLEIGETWVSGVGLDAATLNATVNPLGIPGTGYFQYVDEAAYEADVKQAEEEGKSPEEVAEAGFAHATRVPAGEEVIEFGAGESFKVGSAALDGLTPGTAYRYRLLATNSLITREIPSPVRAFRTLRAGATGGLPDSRAWELVSPAQKNSAEVAIPRTAGGVFSDGYTRIQAAGRSGEAITYTSWTAFANPSTALGASQYLSRRDVGGWVTENISPSDLEGEPLFERNPLYPAYRGFSPDLRWGGLVLSQATESGERINNLFLRDNEAGSLRRTTIEDPILAPGDLCMDYAGASADGSRAIFAANVSYGDAPLTKATTYNLYEWSAAKGLQLASVLPNGTPAVPSEGSTFGASGTGVHCQSGQAFVRNAISMDGNRAFWTYAPSSGATQLMVRLNGEETIQLDKKAAGAPGSSGGGVFRGASTDGSLAFFTAESKLTKGSGAATAAPDLFRYDLGAEENQLIDLTPEALTPGSEPAGVKGVVGISDDGSHVYFVASGVLSEVANEAGQKAQPGADNLYLHHEGQVSFIAAGPGESAWHLQPRNLRARVSPDGRHLAFLSRAAKSLTGYDNTAEGGHCEFPINEEGKPFVGSPLCSQAFLYDAESGELRCASCNPSGARPLGPTQLPAFSNSLEGPRYLSDDGQRLFFESLDSLVPSDENGERDVYEFELAGSGTCTSQSPTFDSTSGGCHYLISTGQSTDATFLLDASGDGRDVFFATRSPLVGWDTDGNYDVYDARVGGGFPEPSQQPSCLGEACKPSVPAPPGQSAPATPSFQGPGNAVGKPKCRKGTVKKRGECVKPKKKKQRKAKRDGRTGR